MVIGKDILSMADISIKKCGISLIKSVSERGEDIQSKENTSKIIIDAAVPELNVGNMKDKDAIQVMEYSTKVSIKTSDRTKIRLTEDISGCGNAFGELANDEAITHSMNEVTVSV